MSVKEIKVIEDKDKEREIICCWLIIFRIIKNSFQSPMEEDWLHENRTELTADNYY